MVLALQEDKRNNSVFCFSFSFEVVVSGNHLWCPRWNALRESRDSFKGDIQNYVFNFVVV